MYLNVVKNINNVIHVRNGKKKNRCQLPFSSGWFGFAENRWMFTKCYSSNLKYITFKKLTLKIIKFLKL